MWNQLPKFWKISYNSVCSLIGSKIIICPQGIKWNHWKTSSATMSNKLVPTPKSSFSRAIFVCHIAKPQQRELFFFPRKLSIKEQTSCLCLGIYPTLGLGSLWTTTVRVFTGLLLCDTHARHTQHTHMHTPTHAQAWGYLRLAWELVGRAVPAPQSFPRVALYPIRNITCGGQDFGFPHITNDTLSQRVRSTPSALQRSPVADEKERKPFMGTGIANQVGTWRLTFYSKNLHRFWIILYNISILVWL